MTETANQHCAANGCPCDGSSTRSTTGSTEWWCSIHFSAVPGRNHEITAELRRLAWLVQITRCIRDFLNTGVWSEVHAAAYKEIAMHQRSDLEMLPSTADLPPETHRQWLARLEGVLQAACAPQPDTQQPLEV